MLKIRPIRQEDNAIIAQIIKNTLTEFGANKPGTVYFDPTTDALFELFQIKKSVYFVAEENEQLLGGCGLFPTAGLPQNCVELVKLYLSRSARGKGIGKILMLKCFEAAKEMDLDSLYLESLPELSQTVAMYHKMGFKSLSAPMGESGHFGCGIWMLKDLKEEIL